MQSQIKLAGVLVIITTYFLMGYFVYTDPVGRQSSPLSESALKGQQLWRKNGCQNCHQIFGLGGFLGTDLTNAADRHTVATLSAVVAVGPAQMPKFSLTGDEVQDLYSYLSAISHSGRSPANARHDTKDHSLKDIPWFMF